MVRKALLAVAFVGVSGSLAVAQDHRVEIAGTAGWTRLPFATPSS